MSTATTHPAAPAPLEIPVPVAGVPSLDQLRRLTEIPDRHIVFRGIDWAFYEELVDSIPEGSNIHVDYDGRDLEITAKGADHEDYSRLLDWLVGIFAEEYEISYKGLAETTWKRATIARGLESDQCYFFSADKRAQIAAARRRESRDIADYPNPDLAVEVDISRPEVDHAGIYAALRVAEVWRFEEDRLIIERLTPEGTYAAVDASGFLPVRADEVHRWIVEEDSSDDAAWARRLRAEIRRKRGELPPEEDVP
jgi:Uma2 family endonuclease